MQQPPRETHLVTETIEHIEELAERAEKDFLHTITPLRQNLINRYPIVFLFLVTFGFAAVTFGVEHLFLSLPFLAERPLIVLFVGLGVLALTGAAYKQSI